MLTIRDYREDDAERVGALIANTYCAFNLSFAPPGEGDLFLGPFRYAQSPEDAHRVAISEAIRAPLVFVAEDEGEILGVLRGGRKDRLQSLFVRGDHHRQGIGRRLVEHFERASLQRGASVVRVAATQYAVPFYLALGYKKSTGLRFGTSFGGSGLPMQPMRKVLRDVPEPAH